MPSRLNVRLDGQFLPADPAAATAPAPAAAHHHACPGAAAAGHVRPTPGVPRDAGGPWWRWLTTALQKY